MTSFLPIVICGARCVLPVFLYVCVSVYLCLSVYVSMYVCVDESLTIGFKIVQFF